jgi:hypothetical protein
MPLLYLSSLVCIVMVFRSLVVPNEVSPLTPAWIPFTTRTCRFDSDKPSIIVYSRLMIIPLTNNASCSESIPSVLGSCPKREDHAVLYMTAQSYVSDSEAQRVN